jgi:hypothetical protein
MEGGPAQEEALDIWLGFGRTMVAELEGAAESVVVTAPATFRHLKEDLPLSAVMSVATSHVGRKRALASRLTATLVARDAVEGALVAALGVFEQGYYNQLGFGSGSYACRVSFDPAQLAVRARHRVPRRLTPADWEAVHAARLQRARGHGAVNIVPPEASRGEMLFTKNPFGLGYFDGPGGTLSHYVWGGAGGMAHGPLHVKWLVYQTRGQFLELMALLRSLGDQVHLVTMGEPPGVQLQDLMRRPLKQRRTTEKSAYAAGIGAGAWWQMRICDLAGCLARTRLPAGPLTFNLHLSDPIEPHLAPDAAWRGVAGEYVVTLGPSSGAERGTHPSLPTLTATANAFTRMWIGVRPASGLAMTDDVAGPPDLLAQLDKVLRLPMPTLDWEF